MVLSKFISILCVLVSAIVLCIATALYPGGFDWSKDFISTMLRGPSGPARTLADVGVLVFCVSLAFVFARLARAPEFSKNSKLIQIAGIGSMVYSAIVVTPLHDLMVTISLLFFLAAVVPLILALRANGEIQLFIAGCVCLAILIASAACYYASLYVGFLPWGQRASCGLFAVWLVSLDYRFPRVPTEGRADLQPRP